MRWVERYFGDIPGRKVPKRPSFREPPLTQERRGTIEDSLAPTPATAIAWRTSDPADLAGFLPYVVLAEVLTDGDASRLQERMLLKDRTATSIGGYLGLLGDPLDARDPTPFMLEVHHPGEVSADLVVETVAEELDRLVQDGLDADEVQRTVARMVSRYLREIDPVLGRATHAAVFEQQRGRAELLNDLPAAPRKPSPPRTSRWRRPRCAATTAPSSS